jgi:hypothetical protein
MPELRNKLASSRPGQSLRDVRSKMFPSKVVVGKRRSKTPSPIGEISLRSSESTSESMEARTKNMKSRTENIKSSSQSSSDTFRLARTKLYLSMSFFPDNDPAQPRLTKGDLSRRCNYLTGETPDEVMRIKKEVGLPHVLERERILPWSQVQWNVTAPEWQRRLGYETPNFDYAGLRSKPRYLCRCGGECVKGTSGSQNQDRIRGPNGRNNQDRPHLHGLVNLDHVRHAREEQWISSWRR